jgi:hypothetical protein
MQDEEYVFIGVPHVRCLTSISFDADLPLLCNDEDLGELGLKSPAKSPTQMCSFIASIKLTQILAFSLRTLVSCTRESFAPVVDNCHSTRQRNQGSSLVTLESSGKSAFLPPSIQP